MPASRESCTEFLDVVVEHETEGALLCIIDSEKYWVPKSQIHDDSEVYKLDTEGALIVVTWWAKKAGLV